MGKQSILVDYLVKYTPTPIVWLFLLQAFVFYVAHGIVNPLAGSHQTLLFAEMSELNMWIPVTWGLMGLVSVVCEFIGVVTNSRMMTKFFAYMQVSLWVFAAFVYASNGLIMLMLAVAIPQTLFWAWNQTVRYDHDRVVNEAKGTIRRHA